MYLALELCCRFKSVSCDCTCGVIVFWIFVQLQVEKTQSQIAKKNTSFLTPLLTRQPVLQQPLSICNTHKKQPNKDPTALQGDHCSCALFSENGANKLTSTPTVGHLVLILAAGEHEGTCFSHICDSLQFTFHADVEMKLIQIQFYVN